MEAKQSTPEPRRILPTKRTVSESNYSPRTLQNTRTRFAGLFTVFGLPNNANGSPRSRKYSPGTGTSGFASSVAASRSRLPVRSAIPALEPQYKVEGDPGSEGATKPIDMRVKAPLENDSGDSFISQSEPTSSSAPKVWSFLLPSPGHPSRRLSPASSLRQRLRTKGKGKGKMEEEDDEEWDEACFVDLEDGMKQMGLTRRDVKEPSLTLPLPDELLLQIIEALPATRAVYRTLSLTCKTLARLAETQGFWRRLSSTQSGWRPPDVERGVHVDYKQLYQTRTALTRQWCYDAADAIEADKPVIQRMTLQSHTDSVYAAQISGRWLVTGSRDRTIKIWRLPALNARWTAGDQEGALVKTVEKAHEGSVLALQFEEVCRSGGTLGKWPGLLVTGSSDFTIGIWIVDWTEGSVEVVRTTSLRGHTNGVLDLLLTKELIISASKDATVKIWSKATYECLHTLAEHEGPVNAVAVNDSETQLASLSGDGRLIIWNASSGEVVRIISSGGRGLACGRWSGDCLVVGSNDRDFKLYHPGTSELLRTFQGHTDLVRSIALDVNIGVAVTGSYDHTVRIWNLRTGALLRAVPAHDKLVFGVRMDKTRLISFSIDNNIVVQQLGVGLPHLDLCT